MGAMARRHPELVFLTVSPGATSGTNVMDNMPGFMGVFLRNVGMKFMPMMGIFHKLEKGARRYVDGLYCEQELAHLPAKSGMFLASKKGKLAGPLVDQGVIADMYADQTFQDAAYEAVHKFV
mmetsp:Transcript_19988/g.51101  ORF Transcript_19988/g.51101 Transcript_19988/m.51101 type:complete len:122 (+) Transcript_19988:3-368(+)